MSSQVQETLAECLAAAESTSPHEEQFKALQTMASLTKVSFTNRNLLAQNGAAVDTLLVLSKSASSTVPVQAMALSVLFNLSLNPNLKASLAATDVIRHLNSVVLSPTSSPQSAKLAASLICSLAMLDKNKAKFGVVGTVEAIVYALGTGVDGNPASHHLLSSLAELVQFHGNCTLAARSGAVPMLVRILEGPHDDLAGTSVAILGLLSTFEEGMGAIRAVDGIVGLLVDGLKRRCVASRESAAKVLIRLFEESDECVREAAGTPDFSTSLADLSIGGSVTARENAGVLMRKMMEADLDFSVEGNPGF